MKEMRRFKQALSDEEKIRSIRIFAEKLSPKNPRLEEWIRLDLSHLALIEIEIDFMTGKESIEYVRDEKYLSRKRPENPKRNTVK